MIKAKCICGCGQSLDSLKIGFRTRECYIKYMGVRLPTAKRVKK